jgi:hypothetical protein
VPPVRGPPPPSHLYLLRGTESVSAAVTRKPDDGLVDLLRDSAVAMEILLYCLFVLVVEIKMNEEEETRCGNHSGLLVVGQK